MGRIKEYYHDTITPVHVTLNEAHIHDWGRKDYQQELLIRLQEWRDSIDTQDVEAHVWLSRFETLVKQLKP